MNPACLKNFKCSKINYSSYFLLEKKDYIKEKNKTVKIRIPDGESAPVW